jgi:hypothetical protein
VIHLFIAKEGFHSLKEYPTFLEVSPSLRANPYFGDFNLYIYDLLNFSVKKTSAFIKFMDKKGIECEKTL